ncbi:MAG: hypothetical protein QOK19_1276 [Solirubrobacteraceae bacterium]|jgi:hypothetical protein|nr:hypothetical protein [Solirubrobacterales bacterium]MEA2215715.1 hypothetical protein [Solirubrobacteraceae bacterium]
MKRISLFAAITAAVIASSASVAVATPPGASRAATRMAAPTKTPFTIEYNASGYYGAVKCTGTHVVSKKFPGGKDVETCETTEGQLKRMVAGKGQKEFETEGGGHVAEWESDSGSAQRTTNFTYNVNKGLTKFKLIAIYAPPPA